MTKYQSVVLKIIGATAGQTISISATATGGSSIAWSAGQDFQDSSGVAISADSGTLPLTSLSVNTQTISLQTSSGGGGGYITLTMSLFLSASDEVDEFYLRNDSDGQINVTAAIGNVKARPVGGGVNTPFDWSP